MKAHTILLFCAAIALATPFIAHADEKNPLEGTKWTLVFPKYVGLDAAPTLEFRDGRMAAYAGCNRMGASYQINGRSFKVGQMISTMMACNEAKMNAESDYSTGLQSATRFALGKDSKTLRLDGTREFAFVLAGGEKPLPAPQIRKTDHAGRGDLLVTIGEKTQVVAPDVWKFWTLKDGTILYAGSDGGGGFENEGQSLWSLNPKTGTKKKLIAEVFAIETVREVGGLLLLSMRDGGLGAPHLNIVRRATGESVYRQLGAYLSAIRNGRLAIAILPEGEVDGRAKRINYLQITTLTWQR